MSIELETLVGLHYLSGVDRLEEMRKLNEWSGDEACDVIRFVLDDITYAVIEDPKDGYRSSMEGCFISDTPVYNRFASIQVFGLMRLSNGYGNTHHVLDLYDVLTAKIVLSVGTSNTDDYYPCFVATFSPENMSSNKDWRND